MNRLLFTTLLAFSLFCISCGDDEDTPPEIRITSPAGNSTFTTGDLVLVMITVTDDVDITSIQVDTEGLFSTNDVVDLSGISDTEVSSTTTIQIVPSTSKGTFPIKVTASDNEGNTSTEETNIIIV